MKIKPQILITGPTSPIGGVTVHVNRLVQSLESKEVLFTFKKLSVKNIPAIIFNIPFHKIFHLHTSRLSFMFLMAAYCKLFNTQSILTYHAEVGVYSGLNRWFEKQALRLIDTPIMLNTKSLRFAQSINKKAVQISSFLPPILEEEPLKNIAIQKIQSLKKEHTAIFCTNAFKRFTMPSGKDVYGIGSLINIFRTLPESALIISDPSGENKAFHKTLNTSFPNNIFFIDYTHSFIEVLKLSDCMIRATLTDGDSISIKEALYLGKNVICSDVVSRPASCILYKTGNSNELKSRIENFSFSDNMNSRNLNGFTEILKLYYQNT